MKCQSLHELALKHRQNFQLISLFLMQRNKIKTLEIFFRFYLVTSYTVLDERRSRWDGWLLLLHIQEVSGPNLDPDNKYTQQINTGIEY
jgi:hypothetical protein